jgi:polar amino acid transport system permease protein
VNSGEVVVIMGPSGSGKSTLLRMINHLEPLDWGEIAVDGQLVGYERLADGFLRPVRKLTQSRAAARIGMVFQHFNLFEHLTALENVIEAPVTVYRQPPEEARATAARLLAAVGLARHTGHLPHRLSGGQQQRVAIARALVNRPRLILADEPTGNLDSHASLEMMALLQQLGDEGMTIILVTHEPDIAAHARRVIVVRDGLIEDDRLTEAPRQAAHSAPHSRAVSP